jgi:hypothetical protein
LHRIQEAKAVVANSSIIVDIAQEIQIKIISTRMVANGAMIFQARIDGHSVCADKMIEDLTAVYNGIKANTTGHHDIASQDYLISADIL